MEQQIISTVYSVQLSRSILWNSIALTSIVVMGGGGLI